MCYNKNIIFYKLLVHILSDKTGVWLAISMILIFAILIVALSIIGVGGVYGQNIAETADKVEEVQEQVEANNAQIDATTVTGGAAVVGAGVAIAREYINTKKLKKEDQLTDKDVGNSLLIRHRLIQSMEAYVPGMKEALDQPFYNDPMLKHITIRNKVAEDSQGWATYMMTVLQAPPPSMTPSASVLLADLNNQTQATQAKTEQQTPPASNNTTQQASSST